MFDKMRKVCGQSLYTGPKVLYFRGSWPDCRAFASLKKGGTFLTNRIDRSLRILYTVKAADVADMRWEHSSAGRASALQAGGHRFDPYCSHQPLRIWRFAALMAR
jgi:hypothetical protein